MVLLTRVGRSAGREVEDERDAHRAFAETINLTGEPAPRPKGCSRVSLLRRQPGHDREPSSNPGGGGSCRPSPGQVATASQTAASLHRRKRQTVIHVLLRQIAPRHPGADAHKMPLTICRLSNAGRRLRPRPTAEAVRANATPLSLRSPRLLPPSEARS